jgi:hypothetical protein
LRQEIRQIGKQLHTSSHPRFMVGKVMRGWDRRVIKVYSYLLILRFTVRIRDIRVRDITVRARVWFKVPVIVRR